LEAYLIDVADIDLYGKKACVEFVSLLRPMVTFDSVATLVEQMGKDVSEARAALALR
jgi:riboflavin kinase/FMN adenylyltransferase